MPDYLMTALGVAEFDERVYRTLLAHPELPAGEIARRVEARTVRVGQALRRLDELGLVSHLGDRPRRYVPVMPEVGVEWLARIRDQQILGARAATSQLNAEYRAGRSDDPGELVEILSGEMAVAHRFAEIQQSCKHELLMFDRPPYAAAPDNPGQNPVLARGVRWRTIYSPESLERPHAREHVDALIEAGEEARTLPGLPMKLVIVDRRIALLPLSLESGLAQSAVIHKSTLLDAMVTLFDVFWARALPLGRHSASTAGELGDEEERMLGLMVVGVKDEAIARELGIGLRTLRRRMQHLLHLLDAETRFQAGIQASRRGWV